MSRPFICVGDRIDHGGAVVSGSPFTDVDGKPVSRINDRVVCERHGPTTIVTGDSTMIIDGQPVARDGDKTACGATLISSQVMAFVDSGSGGGRVAMAMPVAATATGATRPEPHAHEHAPVQQDSGKDPINQQKARDAVRDANKALRSADAYRAYDTELEAAKAWREHVLPVADDHGAEIGAIISRAEDGKYYLGGAYSNGAGRNVSGLIEHGPSVHGKTTAYIHTHPSPNSMLGRHRAFVFNDFPDGDSLGGENHGGDLDGDLITAYAAQLNMYIADSAGLHGWMYDDYRQMQRQTIGATPLGEAYRTF